MEAPAKYEQLFRVLISMSLFSRNSIRLLSLLGLLTTSTFLTSCTVANFDQQSYNNTVIAQQNNAQVQAFLDNQQTLQEIKTIRGDVKAGVVAKESFSSTWKMFLSPEITNFAVSVPLKSDINIILYRNEAIPLRFTLNPGSTDEKHYSVTDVNGFTKENFEIEFPLRRIYEIMTGQALIPVYLQGELNPDLIISDGKLIKQVDYARNTYYYNDYRLLQGRYWLPHNIKIVSPNNERIIIQVKDNYTISATPKS